MTNDWISFDLFDRPRRLRFDVSACRSLFEESGREIFDLFPSQWGPGSAALFLWAGLRWEDRRLTKAAVDQLLQGYLVKGGRIAEIATPLNEALDRSGLLRALAPPKANGADPDPPSGGGSTVGVPSSTGATDSPTPESGS